MPHPGVAYSAREEANPVGVRFAVDAGVQLIDMIAGFRPEVITAQREGIRAEVAVGFFSLSRDRRALYIRELQVTDAFRGQGAGSWALDQVIAMACTEGLPALRLTVFKNNPAQSLYKRKGLKVCGEDECFLRMQLDFGTSVL